MRLKMTIEGMNQLEKDWDKIKRGVLSTRQAVEGCCRRIKFVAQSLVPVETGALRDSIDYEMRGQTLGVVGLRDPGAQYWFFVEFGTVQTPAHPFFRPAVEAQERGYVAQVTAIIDNVVR